MVSLKKRLVLYPQANWTAAVMSIRDPNLPTPLAKEYLHVRRHETLTGLSLEYSLDHIGDLTTVQGMRYRLK